SCFACILAHSRPLWRFMFFSKRAFHALSSCSHCSGDKPFLLLLMFLAVVALIVVASCVSYLLLRCAPPHGSSFGLSLRSYQFAVSTPFGVHPSVHPRSQPPGEYACVPSFPSRQESAGKSRAPPPQTPPAAPAQASDFRTPLLARPAKQISCLLHEKPAILRGSTLPPPPGSAQSCESLLRSSGDSVDYGVSDSIAYSSPLPTMPFSDSSAPFKRSIVDGFARNRSIATTARPSSVSCVDC